MEAVDGESTVGLRLKREDCKRTRHDSDFSKWQVLIGPNDWEDYSLGKEGAARYRVHNLPSAPDPGLYELGIAATHSGLGREISKIDADGIVVVYLGQADNVRARLQRYGRSGAHLGNCYSTVGTNESPCQNGPGLFEEMFSRGHSILFRWAPMKTKRDAEKMESHLLNAFDYAWNKGGNGVRRPDDILQKVNEVASTTSKFSSMHRKLQRFTQKRVGIKIEGSKPFSPENKSDVGADEENNNFFSGIFKFSRSRPRLVSGSDNFGTVEDSDPICGVILNDGAACRRFPVQGRKRCEEHKGMRIYGFGSKSRTDGQSHYVPIADPDSTSCNDQNYHTACGVNLGDGTFCLRQPVVGRKRCEEHKGMRVNGIVSKSATGDKLQVPAIHFEASTSSAQINNNASTSGSKDFTVICGATLGNGSFCRRQPVEGNKRCWQHKSRRADFSLSKTYVSISTSDGQTSCITCGVALRNGSVCARTPVPGRKRCEQHKGMRLTSSY